GSPGLWRAVVKATPRSGRGSILGPDTSRRAHWWDLNLDGCGHLVQRTARFRPLQPPQIRSRGGTSHRSWDDARPAPNRVRCEQCRPGDTLAAARAAIRGKAHLPPDWNTGCPLCGSDDYDTEPGADGQPDYENGLKTCQECGEEWV